MTSCEKGTSLKPYTLPDFKNPSVSTIKNNLEFPSGLSGLLSLDGFNSKSENQLQNIVTGVFIEGPIFENLWSYGGLQITQNPKISRYELDLDQLSENFSQVNNLTLHKISEIDLAKYPTDFDSFNYFGYWITLAEPDSIWRATNLVLDNCMINNDSILTSSNSSDKVLITDSSGEIEVFLEDPQLSGITDLVYAKNGKIYATQAPILDQTDPTKVIRPKRVISIKKESIVPEFDIPTGINSEFLTTEYNLTRWQGFPCIEQVKIIENSEEGKKTFKNEYYIADLLGNVIYSIDKNKNINVLARNLNYPTSIAVDSTGNLFYTSSPLFNLPSPNGQQVVFHESLYAINPESGTTKLICEFGSDLSYEYSCRSSSILTINNYQLIPDLNITNVLYETINELYFMITNTRLGNIYVIKIDK